MAGKKISKPSKTFSNRGAPIGDEHHSPSPNAKKAHGEKATIVGGKVDKAVKGEYKGEKPGSASERFSDYPANTTLVGAQNTEKQFRKENAS